MYETIVEIDCGTDFADLKSAPVQIGGLEILRH